MHEISYHFGPGKLFKILNSQSQSQRKRDIFIPHLPQALKIYLLYSTCKKKTFLSLFLNFSHCGLLDMTMLCGGHICYFQYIKKYTMRIMWIKRRPCLFACEQPGEAGLWFNTNVFDQGNIRNWSLIRALDAKLCTYCTLVSLFYILVYVLLLSLKKKKKKKKPL